MSLLNIDTYNTALPIQLCRVFSVIIVTARNVTYAMYNTPDSSEAFESGRKIMSIIQDSENKVERGAAVVRQKKTIYGWNARNSLPPLECGVWSYCGEWFILPLSLSS